MAVQQARRVLVYGGKGALGSACVSFFKSKEWWVGSIDMHVNDDADANIVVPPKDSWPDQSKEVLCSLGKILENEKIDALICVAGGWAGGNASSDEFIKNSDLMWKQSVWPSVISANIATKYLKEGGLVALTGAKAALEGTPGMIGYGMAKAAVHQLVSSLAGTKSGLPNDSLVVAILPVTLDTPMNRKFMPKADFSSWTPTNFVAELLFSWASRELERPQNGSLVKVMTEKGKTEISFA